MYAGAGAFPRLPRGLSRTAGEGWRATRDADGAGTPRAPGRVASSSCSALGVVLRPRARAAARLYIEQQRDFAALRSESGSARPTSRPWRPRSASGAPDAYVEARARDRLHFVLPGEIGYVVPGPGRRRPPPRPTSRRTRVRPGASGARRGHLVQPAVGHRGGGRTGTLDP